MINKICGYSNNSKQNTIKPQISFGTAYDASGKVLSVFEESKAIFELILATTNPKKPFKPSGCNLPELVHYFNREEVNGKISRITCKPQTKKKPLEIVARLGKKYVKIVQDYYQDSKEPAMNSILSNAFNTLVIILERLNKP